ncbi:MAG: DUF4339 domain-containing protein [Eubacteriales bacterium]|nr:DUF4339 domain-containing protein [Eubacteriales bacterium]
MDNESPDFVTPEWYVNVDSVQYGPFTYPELVAAIREGRVAASDPVWNPKLPDWTRADSIPELFQISDESRNRSGDQSTDLPREFNQNSEQCQQSEIQGIRQPSNIPGRSRLNRLIPLIAITLGVIVFFSVYILNLIHKRDDPGDSNDMASSRSAHTAGITGVADAWEAEKGEKIQDGTETIENAFRAGDVAAISQRTHPMVRDKYSAMYEKHKIELPGIALLLETRVLVYSDDSYAEYKVTDTSGRVYFVIFEKIDGIWYLSSL